MEAENNTVFSQETGILMNSPLCGGKLGPLSYFLLTRITEEGFFYYCLKINIFSVKKKPTSGQSSCTTQSTLGKSSPLQ